MNPLSYLKLAAAGAALALIVALGAAARGYKSERDVARATLAATQVERDAERINAKTAVQAAETCAAEHAGAQARCSAALAAANAAADRARAAAAACDTDEGVAAGLGAVIQ